MSRARSGPARAVALLALCGACARAAVWPPAPVELRPGEDSCAECRMIVSDSRFAVQRHSPADPVEWFDDLGCLVEQHGPGGSDPQGVFVHAFEAEAWLRGDRGYAARSADFDSPMGYGWRAFPTLEGAREAAAGHADADVRSLIELLRDGAAEFPPRPSPPEQPRRR